MGGDIFVDAILKLIPTCSIRSLATHMCMHRSILAMLRHYEVSQYPAVGKILELLVKQGHELIRDMYGQRVLQYVFVYGREEDKRRLLQMVAGDFRKLVTDRAARHVVNMSFLVAADDTAFDAERQRLAAAALEDGDGCPLQTLVEDGVQKIAATIVMHSPESEKKKMLAIVPGLVTGEAEIRSPKEEIAFELKPESENDKLDWSTAGGLDQLTLACAVRVVQAAQEVVGTWQEGSTLIADLGALDVDAALSSERGKEN